jgi:hypothetical protein
MNTERLLKEIDEVFPLVEKPVGVELSFHKDDCGHCVYLRRDLEKYTEKALSADVIHIIHDEMSSLSAKGWRWALPSYLKYCITVNVTDYVDDRETEFLIYSLSPSKEFENETIEHLSELNKEQIECLIHFLEWCQNHQYWSDYCAENLANSIIFLKKLT